MAKDIPAQAITWIYGNIDGSGVNEDDLLREPDYNWSKNGKLVQYD